MNYLLCGEDDFSIHEAISSLKNQLGDSSTQDANITELDGSKTSFDQLSATCNTLPFLSEKRLVIVHGLLTLFEGATGSRNRSRVPRVKLSGLSQWKQLAEYLPIVPKTTDLVFIDSRLSSSNKLLSSIRPKVTMRTFPTLPPHELRKWIHKRVESEGTTIEPDAVEILTATIGGNLWVVSSELQKLSTYRKGHPISQKDVKDLVFHAKEHNVFSTVDTIFEGDPAVAIKMVNDLLQAGNSPSYILAMVTRHVRLLILSKDLNSRGLSQDEIGKRLGLSGYPLRKTLNQEKQFKITQLVDIHGKLLDADSRIRSWGTREDAALDLLITEIYHTRKIY